MGGWLGQSGGKHGEPHGAREEQRNDSSRHRRIQDRGPRLACASMIVGQPLNDFYTTLSEVL